MTDIPGGARTAQVARMIADAGFGVRSLPACKPGLNLIEAMLSEPRASPRNAKVRTSTPSTMAIVEALRKLSSPGLVPASSPTSSFDDD